MSGFDIGSLLKFKPAKFHCERCFGLLTETPKSFGSLKENPKCPVCKITYVATDDFYPWQMDKYLEQMGYSIQIKNIFEHSKNLATIAHKVRTLEDGMSSYPPLRGLLEALSQAEQFVHFTSYKISQMLLGALKLTAQRVKVRGIVSGIDDDAKKELDDFKSEAPQLRIRTFATDNWKEMPHQKLIVIDGLLAFKGSANLTLNAWRKAPQGLELVEVVSDIEEVINLHNKYFSPVWAATNTNEWTKKPIEMFDLPFRMPED